MVVMERVTDDVPRTESGRQRVVIDPGLVRAAQGGDMLAMQDLLDTLMPFVGRVCGPIALSDGADAAQETLVAVFRNLHRLREPEALMGWVRTIATRESVRLAKLRRPQVGSDTLDEVATRGDPEVMVDVTRVLERMTLEHRTVLVLHDIEGLDDVAIADVLGIPRGTVKSRVSRARVKFRQEWQA